MEHEGECKMHILIIEDDRELCEALTLQLHSCNHTVSVCHTGSEALYFAMSGAYDLILLDRMLPEIDGLSILRSIRQNHIAAPVILTTALGSVGDKIDGLDCGADDYLVKPYDTKELLARIRALYKLRQAILSGYTIRHRYPNPFLSECQTSAFQTRSISSGIFSPQSGENTDQRANLFPHLGTGRNS